MNGSDRILSRIRSDGDASVRSIEEQAHKERDRIIAEAQHKADTQAAAIAEQAAKKRAQTEAAGESRAQLERRNALLRQRRKEIDKTVDALERYFLGLDDRAYFEALYRLAAQLKGKSGVVLLNKKDLKRKPKDFEKKLETAGVSASVSQQPADISGGFILKSGDVEENMAFSALIGARRGELEDFINRELFAR